jgi:hypothetical protein
MSQPGYYEDLRYCAQCAEYVPYLIALEPAFCARCDQPVRLFSEDDRREFVRSLAKVEFGAAEAETSASAQQLIELTGRPVSRR